MQQTCAIMMDREFFPDTMPCRSFDKPWSDLGPFMTHANLYTRMCSSGTWEASQTSTKEAPRASEVSDGERDPVPTSARSGRAGVGISGGANEIILKPPPASPPARGCEERRGAVVWATCGGRPDEAADF